MSRPSLGGLPKEGVITFLARQVGHAAGSIVKVAQDLTGKENPGNSDKDSGKNVGVAQTRGSPSKKHSKRAGRRKSSVRGTGAGVAGKKVKAPNVIGKVLAKKKKKKTERSTS